MPVCVPVPVHETARLIKVFLGLKEIAKMSRLYAIFFEMAFTGVSPSGKAAVFGTAMRRFESFHPKLS